MASSGPNDFLASAKEAAASAGTTLGQQGEKVGAAAAGAQKTVGEYVTKATDYVQGNQEVPPKSEGKVGAAAAGVQKTVGDFATKATDYVQGNQEVPPKSEGKVDAAAAGVQKTVGGLFK
ncbi:hypothetical protein TSUD_94320 [Trifolium subterraneum]|uniref:Uncharacterized protein n=1 Tax=Trifolium subterraneum TaxID=3900 RepID=A0A2Z6P4Z1_TRISU|nr:hypothetical protein TSUD_94320 [Trifolium subterraneum]